ncbi:MAG: hypothetical protein DGJ47_000235 [Rickettsiaceae bacterium]
MNRISYIPSFKNTIIFTLISFALSLISGISIKNLATADINFDDVLTISDLWQLTFQILWFIAHSYVIIYISNWTQDFNTNYSDIKTSYLPGLKNVIVVLLLYPVLILVFPILLIMPLVILSPILLSLYYILISYAFIASSIFITGSLGILAIFTFFFAFAAMQVTVINWVQGFNTNKQKLIKHVQI